MAAAFVSAHVGLHVTAQGHRSNRSDAMGFPQILHGCSESTNTPSPRQALAVDHARNRTPYLVWGARGDIPTIVPTRTGSQGDSDHGHGHALTVHVHHLQDLGVRPRRRPTKRPTTERPRGNHRGPRPEEIGGTRAGRGPRSRTSARSAVYQSPQTPPAGPRRA